MKLTDITEKEMASALKEVVWEDYCEPSGGCNAMTVLIKENQRLQIENTELKSEIATVKTKLNDCEGI
jgi:regulator of replication initiation timing